MRINGLGNIDTVAQAIQTQEGFYAGTLAFLNNNPGNLVPAGQPGCTSGAGGFCSFPTYEMGYQALINQINLDASRGYTILQFTTKYLGGNPNNPGVAPGGDPNGYASNIANATGLSVNDPLSAALSGGFSVDPATGMPSGDPGPIDMGLGTPQGTMLAVAVGGAILLVLVLR